MSKKKNPSRPGKKEVNRLRVAQQKQLRILLSDHLDKAQKAQYKLIQRLDEIWQLVGCLGDGQ